MDIKVSSSYLKISPRKLQVILHGLRGQNAETARVSLMFTYKKGAAFAADLVKAGIAAAKENDLDLNKVTIKAIYSTDGPRLKRRHIGSRGRSEAIIKRMSHLTLVLTDGAEEKAKPAKEKVSKEEVKEAAPTPVKEEVKAAVVKPKKAKVKE